MLIKIGEKIDREYGYYSDEIECWNDPSHKVLWWYEGAFCLNENKYVEAKTIERFPCQYCGK